MRKVLIAFLVVGILASVGAIIWIVLRKSSDNGGADPTPSPPSPPPPQPTPEPTPKPTPEPTPEPTPVTYYSGQVTMLFPGGPKGTAVHISPRLQSASEGDKVKNSKTGQIVGRLSTSYSGGTNAIMVRQNFTMPGIKIGDTIEIIKA